VIGMRLSIVRLPRSSAYRLTAAVMAGCVFSTVASCVMESEQKPTVELRLESPLSPEAIPFSDEERETVRKHPVTGESVQAWCNRELAVEHEGETISFPAERAYAHIEQGKVVSVGVTVHTPGRQIPGNWPFLKGRLQPQKRDVAANHRRADFEVAARCPGSGAVVDG